MPRTLRDTTPLIRTISIAVVLTVLAGLAAAFAFMATQNREPVAVSDQVANYTPDPLVDRPLALAIGDSQANGSGLVSYRTTWVSKGLARAGFRPVIRGYGGTGFLKDRAPGSLDEGHPNFLTSLREDLYELPERQVGLILFQGGGNDIPFPPAEVKAAASESIGILRAKYPEAEVVLVGSLNQTGNPTSPRLRASKLWSEIASENGASFVDATAWVTDARLQDLFLEDGQHFNQEGHDKAGELLAADLRDLGIETHAAEWAQK